MNKRYLYFNLGVGFWLLALTACLSYSTVLTLVLACLALGSFTLHCSQLQNLNMFKINKKPSNDLQTKNLSLPALLPSEENGPHTIIAKDNRVEGNLTSSGQIEIFGEVKGDIHVTNGLVRILSSGRVEGNITCDELYIDGSVRGKCTADIINIDEHGNINGVLTYTSLSIQHGAIVVGTLCHVNKLENLAHEAPFEPKEISLQKPQKQKQLKQEVEILDLQK
ncbi:bactofilin family protein [Yersinia massiliensis]|uniref:bactofilin family protein n=2 Tax=Yersinia massiliensis TaxID=419257 RepID=UPI00031C8A50|nr:polymer-forming cytoskeletal protein [Yersinia massiliensis]MCB5309523.1 polymer-forming cytoskeletal protein [Yersinia massiliensis]